MIKVEPLESYIKHEDILDHTQLKIREEREIIRCFLNRLDAQVKAYLDPDTEYSSLKPMMTTKNKLTKVLYGLYDSNEKLIKDMKDEIKRKYEQNYFSHHGERCPYCGILRQSSSVLDHFLPRGVFREYSILSLNLVYICERCNNKEHKGSLINDEETGKRLFLHPYTDDELETYTFIKCNLSFDDLTVLPTFTINENIKDINPEIYDIACNHMNKLKLNKRYGDLVENDLLRKFRNKFTELNRTTNLRQYKNDLSLDDILEYINVKIEEWGDTNLNNWELIFWNEFLKQTVWLEDLPGKELE